MSQKYHVNPQTHESGPCGAIHGKCPFEHYDSAEEAQQAAVEMSESSPDAKVAPLKKKGRARPEERDYTENDMKNFSFVDDFGTREKRFEAKFGDIPNTFYKKDITNLVSLYKYDPNVEEEVGFSGRIRNKFSKVVTDLTKTVSRPADADLVDEDFVREHMKMYGGEKLTRIEGDSTGDLKSGYLISYPTKNRMGKDGTAHIMIHDDFGSKKITPYVATASFKADRRDPESEVHVKRGENIMYMGRQHFVGDARIHKLTGESAVNAFKTYNAPSPEQFDNLKGLRNTSLNSVARSAYYLRESQREGQNFIAQKKYVSESNRKIATAFDDKKGIDDEHKAMAQSSPLRSRFKHIELDNEVEKEEWNHFEQSFQEIQDKMPPVPDSAKPTLRVRRLGKHNTKSSVVHGMYNPMKNTIALDVHTSGSYVHEQMHQYDMTVAKNASLQRDFEPIIDRYNRHIDASSHDEKHKAYLKTPTEVFARLGERYANEKMGVKNNRLLNEGKFSDEAYTPFDDPELKEKGFAFMDKVFADMKKNSEH